MLHSVKNLFHHHRGFNFFLSRYTSSNSYSCKLLVVGGGTGGCAIAAKFARKLGRDNVIVIDPSKVHYYQPYFTLIGGGIGSVQDCARPMRQVLPHSCTWLKDEAINIDASNNTCHTSQGHKIQYQYLVIAAGLKLNYEKIPGLLEALADPDSGVCSNYSPKYVEKTYKCLTKFKQGNLIFTFPTGPVKCAGAPQKICYIADDYLRKNSLRNKSSLYYCTALPVLFGCKYYADSLWQIVKQRNINVNLQTNLTSINVEQKEATFEILNQPGKKLTINFDFLHVTPPMTPPILLRASKDLADNTGFLDVDKRTMQHQKFKNIFGIGDCTNSPTSKTAAAAAAQCGIVFENLTAAIENKALPASYDGYTSCPLVTSYNSVILAEFNYDAEPLETFPFDQAKERRSMFLLKKYLMPHIYWDLMMKGHWSGPAIARKILNLGMGKKY